MKVTVTFSNVLTVRDVDEAERIAKKLLEVFREEKEKAEIVIQRKMKMVKK
jgi:hypothetical protein